MSKIKVLSDIHIEHNGVFKLEDNHTYVIAGDLGPVDVALDFLKSVHESTTIIFVAGNHEFYGNNFYDGYQDLKNGLRDLPNIHFLQDDYVNIEGVNYFGATLWTDLESPILPKEFIYAQGSRIMNDFRAISSYGGNFSMEDMLESHYKSIVKMTEFFENHKDDNNVIVTHHAPSFKSIHPKYGSAGDIMNYFFASNLDDFILEHKPKMWIHGHTHTNFDYNIGDTRVLCSPKGYYDENPEFEIMTIEV